MTIKTGMHTLNRRFRTYSRWRPYEQGPEFYGRWIWVLVDGDTGEELAEFDMYAGVAGEAARRLEREIETARGESLR